MSKQNAAIAAIAVSTILWLFVFVVPFTDAEAETKWFAAVALYGASYVFFFAAIALVGRDGFAALKEQVKARLR